MRRDDYRRGSQPRCICNPLTGVTCATHAEQSRAAAQGRPMVDETAARAAGWVPLANVLDAVWDIDAIQRWASRSGVPLGSFIGHQQIRDYLADRFGATDATPAADERNVDG